jgi:hypothetical protein
MNKRPVFKLDIIWICVLIYILFSAAGCGPTNVNDYVAKQVAKEMQKEPLHVVHFPPNGKPMPIDGLWKDPWGDRSRIAQGRMFKIDFPYPIVTLSHIKKIASGKYEAENTGSKLILGDQVTLTIVDKDKLLILTESTDRVLYRIKLDNEQSFLADFNQRLLTAKEERNVSSEFGLFLQDFKILPSVVAPGEPFSLSVDYSANDPKLETDIPVVFSYDILKGEKRFFRSKPVTIMCRQGQKNTRVVNLNASKQEGQYSVVVRMSYGDESKKVQKDFKISRSELPSESSQNDNSELSVMERLVGAWVFESPGFPKDRLIITKSGDRLQGRIVKGKTAKGGYIMEYLTLELTDNVLMVRGKEIFNSDCWYEFEEEVTLKEPLDNLPVRVKLTNGNWCIRIGEIFKGKYVRVSEN